MNTPTSIPARRWARAAVLAAAMAMAAGASAQDARLVLDMPAQPLDQALQAVARQSGIQIIFLTDQAAARQAPPLRGTLTAQEALQRLTSGSGLVLRARDANTYILERFDAEGASGAMLAPVLVAGSASGLPPAYAGGQVATGGRLGLLGNRGMMDTPFSVTSYTSKTIQDQQAQTVGDVLMNDPSVRSLYPRGANTDEFMIRGFTLYNREIVFNGLPGLLPFSSVGLEGIERVELLKGPNALLNGMALSGSIGGGINLVPQRAGTAPLNRLTTQYVSDSQLGATADIARRWRVGAGSLGVRGNLAYHSGDGPSGRSSLDMRVATLGLDYTTDRLRLEADFRHQRRAADAPPPLVFPGTVVPALDAPAARGNFAQPWTYLDTTETMGMLRGEFDFSPAVTVFAAIGARKGDYDSLQANWTVQDSQGQIRATPFYNYSEYETLSHEAGLRLKADTGPIHHQIALVASGVTMDTYTFSASLPPAIFSNIYQPIAASRPDIPDFGSAPLVNSVKLTSFGVSDTLSILDQRVQLTLGVRHQKVKVENYDGTTGALTSGYDKSRLTPAVGLVLKPTEALSLYANYIEGLSQGPQAPASAANAGTVFPPFVSKQYEIGAKLDFGRLGLTISAFQIEQPNSFTDPQTNLFRVDGEQRNRGLELTAFGELSDRLRVLGGVAGTSAVLTRTAGGVNDGNDGVGVPKFQANLGAEWDTPFLDGLTVSGRMIYTGSQYLNAANTQKIPGWLRFDMGLRYAFTAQGTPITLRFNVENLFGKGYWASAARGGYKMGAPRTYLMSASFEF